MGRAYAEAGGRELEGRFWDQTAEGGRRLMSEKGDGLLLRGLEDDGLYTLPHQRAFAPQDRVAQRVCFALQQSDEEHMAPASVRGVVFRTWKGPLADTGEIVTTTALAALQVSDPFTKYIFVDNDPRCIEALEARIQALNRDYDVSCIEEDVSEAVPEIMKVMPSYSRDRGYCRFALPIHFLRSWIRGVPRLIGDEDWRAEWIARGYGRSKTDSVHA